MISTEFYKGQGLGNQLWTYVACRSISEKLKLQYVILGAEKFKGNSFLDIDYGCLDLWPTSKEKESQDFSIFYENIFYDAELEYFSSGFDERVFYIKPFTKIQGLFQSEDYLFGDLDLPKKYISIKQEYLTKSLVSDGCCVLNLRGGEYKRHKNLILTKSYWQNAMKNMRDMFGIDDFLVVTDDNRYANALFPELAVLKGGIAECYVALHQAEYLILSNTSFSYFPVKNGINKKHVIAPMHWARFGNDFSRWASPANLYASWVWQDVNGNLHSHADCLHEQEHTSTYYRENYYVSTLPSAVINNSIRGYFPAWLKNMIKKGLSFIFPKHIG